MRTTPRTAADDRQPEAFTWPQLGLTAPMGGPGADVGPKGGRAFMHEAIWAARATNATAESELISPIGIRAFQVLVVMRLWDSTLFIAVEIADILRDKRSNVDRALRTLEAERLISVRREGHRTVRRQINARGKLFVDMNIRLLRSRAEWREKPDVGRFLRTGHTGYRDGSHHRSGTSVDMLDAVLEGLETEVRTKVTSRQ